MFRLPLAFLILLVGSGASGFLFDTFIDFALNFASNQIDRALNDPMQNADDLGTSLLESVDMALGGMLAEQKQSMQLDKIYNAVSELSGQVEELKDYIHEKLDNLLRDWQRILKTVVEYNTCLNRLIQHVSIINQKYAEFTFIMQRYFDRNATIVAKLEVLPFAEGSVSESPGEIRERLGVMHAIFNSYKSTEMFQDGFFLLMAENLEAQYATYCGNQSPQQKLYSTYKAVSIADVKGYMIMKYSYDILSVFHNTSYSGEQIAIADDFIRRRKGYVHVINEALSQPNRYQRACSPPSYERDKNFIELEALYGPYIINQMDMDITYSSEKWWERDKYSAYIYTLRLNPMSPTAGALDPEMHWLDLPCREKSCWTIQNAAESIEQSQERLGKYIYTNMGREMCRGDIIDCTDMGTSPSVCVEPSYGRRYQQINTGTSIYGLDGKCGSEGVNVTLDPVGPYYQCSYCLCQCVNINSEALNIVKWINLNDHVSDIQKNMVITGVKFEKNGNKIEIKIKEGVLMAKGEVPESTWTSGFQGNAMYLEIGRKDSKSLVLKSYEAEDGYIMTGLRFKTYFDKYFGIQIHCTEFDFESGQLNPSKSNWIDVIKPDMIGEELTLENPDDPTESPANYLDSVDGDYVTFAMSDLRKTAGGFVVPFIDSQPVESVPGFALSGAGMIHKGLRGYGGFVAFQLSTYDIYGYIDAAEQTDE